jgi:hypothetical protein
MSTQAWPAQGATLAFGTASGTYASVVNEVLSISHAGGGEVGERDTTVLTSTVRTNAPTIPDNGEMTVELNFDPTDAIHLALRDYKDSPVVIFFKVTFNTTGTTSSAAFAGWVKEFDGPNMEDVDSNITASVTIRVTGAVTWVGA